MRVCLQFSQLGKGGCVTLTAGIRRSVEILNSLDGEDSLPRCPMMQNTSQMSTTRQTHQTVKVYECCRICEVEVPTAHSPTSNKGSDDFDSSQVGC